MTSENPNNGPPAFTSPLQMDELFGFRIGPNEAADCSGISGDGNGAVVDHMPIAQTVLGPNETPNSYPHNFSLTNLDLMSDFTQFNSFQNSQVDHNFINLGGHMPFINGPAPVFPYPEANMNRIYGSDIHGHMATSDNLMNSATHLSSFQNPQMDQNFIAIRGNAGGGFQMMRQGGENNSVNIRRPQTNRNFVSHKTHIPAQFRIPDSGEIGMSDSFRISSFQSDCREKPDGSFLTLGVGDSMEEKSNVNDPSREITSRNERINFPQLNASHGQKANVSSLNPAHNMVGGFSGFQNNVGGFSSLAHNISGLTLSNNDLEVMYGTNAGWNSNPPNPLQTAQVGMPPFVSIPSNRNLVLGRSGNARSVKTDPYKNVQGHPSAASRTLSETQARLLNYGQVGLSGLTTESAKTMRITSQDQSGQQFPAYQGSSGHVTEGGHFPQRIGIQTASNPGRPQNTGPVQHSKGLLGPAFTTGQVIPVARGNALTQPSNLLVGQALRRSAIQPPPAIPLASPVPIRDLLRPNLTIEGNRLAQASNMLVGPSLRNYSIQPVPASPASLLGQLPSKNLLGPSLSTGRVVPVANGNGQSQASSALVGLSRKRGAIQPLPAIPRVQRRKIMPQPYNRPYVPPPGQTASAIHIKRQGSEDETMPRPIGQKCPLCKRDVSFTPEGPLYQPTIRPPVAVLPCGHIFHDQCLQRITPEDQSKDPPCIPCAIDES